MTFQDILKNSFVEKFQTGNAATGTDLMLALGFSLLLALYLFVVYRYFARKSLYNVNFNIAIVGMTVVTTAIMLTIQSNLVLSLGMVGALSIVRYRTAVKDPMDLFFLFWSIAAGIMCGANQYILAIVVTVLLTIVVFLLAHVPNMKAPYVLVVNGEREGLEEQLEEILEEYCTYYKIKSRNIADETERMIVELKTSQEKEFLNDVAQIKDAKVSLLTYEGDITA